jgi:hypothetical protein
MAIGIRVFFEPVTYADIMLAALTCDVEISGLAKVRKEGLDYIVSGEPWVPRQECSLSHTTFDRTAQGVRIHEMIASGRRQELDEERLWWHSHVRGNVYFSRTDEYMISNTLYNSGRDWELSIVVNKFFDFKLRLDEYRPKRLPPIYIEKLEFTEPIKRSEFEELLVSRTLRMEEIVRRNIKMEFPPEDLDTEPSDEN